MSPSATWRSRGCFIGVGIRLRQGWTIENCFVHDVVVDGIHANGTDANPPNGGTIRNCEFRDWDWKGFRLMEHNWQDWGKSEPFMGYAIHVFQGQSWRIVGNRMTVVNMISKMDCSPIAFDNAGHAALIEGNYADGAGRIGGPTTGIMLWNTRGTTPVVIRGNEFRNLGGLGIIVQDFGKYKFDQAVTIENNVLMNICGDDVLDQEAIRVWTKYEGAGLITVRNNVVAGVPKGKNPHPCIHVRQSKAVVANNTLVSGDYGLRVENNSTVTATGNISTGAYRFAASMAAKSAKDNSKLTESNNDWHGKVEGFTPDGSDKYADPKLAAPGEGRLPARARLTGHGDGG